ncbi:MAG: A/G-specific adenine glycosylase [Gammaproteobacteria bacterium]|nr:A/G-specific adenine glycosylase [Gammaproteobacteria bacterium]
MKFQTRVLDWFDKHGRKTLPWQKKPTPYSILVSEVMLQQTQVNTVTPYYLRFIQKFPSFMALARASVDEVLELWSGLGYYARARNLHQTAKIVCEQYGGEFPPDYAKIIKLPGIGRSTAGAILSFAFGARHPILEGNVRRVLARVLGIKEWPGSPHVMTKLWKWALCLVPARRVAEYNQAMMDLGALVCTRRFPRCLECPLSGMCVAYKEGEVHVIPVAKPSRLKPVKRALFLMIVDRSSRVLLERQNERGVWRGLWSFPHCDGVDEINRTVAIYGVKTGALQFLTPFRHTFTHFHWDITPVVLQSSRISKQKGQEDVCWYPLDASREEPSLGLPAPIKRLIKLLGTF